MPNIRAIYLDDTDDENIPSKKQPESKQKPIRFKNIEDVPHQKEPLIISSTLAPFRVVKDLGDTILERMEKIPDYIQKGKTEVPGLVESMINRPFETMRQGYAGVAEGGQQLFNTPHDIINYATNRLHLFPENLNQKVQMARMPEDTQEMINQTFGKPEYPGEELFRFLNKHQSGLTAGGALAKTLLPYVNPKNIPRALKNTSKLEAEAASAEEQYQGALTAEQQEKNAAMRAGHGTGNLSLLEGKKNEAQKKLDNLYTQLNETPPQTLDEHLKASNDLAKYKEEYDTARSELDRAKSESVQVHKTSNPDILINRINEKKTQLTQLENDVRNGQPVTEEQLNSAKNELEAATNEYQQYKDYAESIPGGSSKQNTLQKNINTNQEKIVDLEHKLAEQKQVSNEPAIEENKTFETKKVPDISEFAENEKRATAYHENANQMSNKAESEIAHHVNENADHAVRASREMKKEITSINKYWSDAYKILTDKLKKTKFNLSNRMPDIEEFFISTDNPELLDLLKKSPTTKDVSASDFMTKQKEFRDSRYDLLKRAKEEPNASKRRELFDAYEKSNPVENIINKTLEEGLGEHLPEYRRINEGYSKQVFPLRENPVANKIMDGKPMSSNIASELSGDIEGQNILRELALRNDEVKRNIMGQQYKKGGKDKSSFYNPDETVREYLNTMPDLNRLIGRRENAVNYANESKINLDKSKTLHKEAKENNANIEKENERIEKDKTKYEAKQAEKRESQRITQEKENARIAKEKEQHQKNIKELQEKNTLLGGIKLKLTETSEKKGKLESYHQELKDIKTHQDNTHKSINEISNDLKSLDKHLNAIKSAQEKLKSINKPEKVKTGKIPDVNKMRQDIKDIHEKIISLDEHISKLHKASKNTELKLSKKLEIQKSLDEAKEMKKEAQRRLKVAGIAMTAFTGIHYRGNIKDYLMTKKND